MRALLTLTLKPYCLLLRAAVPMDSARMLGLLLVILIFIWYFGSKQSPGAPLQQAELMFHAVLGGVDARGHRYSSFDFGAVKTRGVHESRMGPHPTRVRWKCSPLMGLYPPRTALWSSNLSAICQQDRGFVTERGGVHPRKLGFLLQLVDVLKMLNDLWNGDGALSSRGGAGSTFKPS